MKIKNAKILFMILLIISVSIFGLAGCNKNDSNKEENENGETNTGSESKFTVTHKVEIEVENYGTIYVDLDAENAPITVNNFIKLVESGFYDGLTFHRIISGFMIQGGDPLGNGAGGSDERIKGEFAVNGIENTLSHTRGAISMARSDDYNSARSQFFIVHQDSNGLDGSYAVFGYVSKGMEIVDKICSEIPVQDRNGTVLKEDQPVIKSIKVIK
jgi:peptidyl-prolyl cis-trans isomerase B (cyclophilin B)